MHAAYDSAKNMQYLCVKIIVLTLSVTQIQIIHKKTPVAVFMSIGLFCLTWILYIYLDKNRFFSCREAVLNVLTWQRKSKWPDSVDTGLKASSEMSIDHPWK